MLEFLLASMFSCESSQKLIDRVNEYAEEVKFLKHMFKKSLTLSKKTTRSANSNEGSEHSCGRNSHRKVESRT